MLDSIKKFSQKFLKETENKSILIVSHHDTDGITSAAIFASCLKRLDKKFSIKIIKQLEEKIIQELPEDKLVVFLDLASSSLEELSKLNSPVFIIDHHDLNSKIPKNIEIINPHLTNSEEMSASCLTYLVSKEISKENKDLANLAIIGLVGDIMEKNIGKITQTIISDSETIIKKGILLYPSTRPLNKALEYCSNPFIPGVTGNSQGAIDLLRETGIGLTQKGYKSLIELSEEEMQKLVTAIVLRTSKSNSSLDFIGNLYLVKFFNKLEDAREISALINACSRMGYSEIALLLCMGNKNAKEKSEKIYATYKQHIVGALNYVNSNSLIKGKNYVIINAKENIKDTIIGTIASILSMSSTYEEGTVIVAMAYNQDKIKVSARISGKNKEGSKNLRVILNSIIENIGGISGGHKLAAGCLISKEKEQAFIELIRKKLDIELIKI